LASEQVSDPALWDIEALRDLEFPIVEYDVGREKLREYVAVMDDQLPVHNDPAVARDLGYRDVIAPPTFAACFTTLPIRAAMRDRIWRDRARVDPGRVMHGEQSFEFYQPIIQGDRLIVQSIVLDVYAKSNLGFLIVGTRVDAKRGGRVLDARSTLVLRP
jgi:acyl dehydratase